MISFIRENKLQDNIVFIKGEIEHLKLPIEKVCIYDPLLCCFNVTYVCASRLISLFQNGWCVVCCEHVPARVGQYFNKSPISPDQVPAIQLLHAFSLRNIIA